MAFQMTIIGLDRVGVSFCLALESQKTNLLRFGYDSNAAIAKKINLDGIFDKVFFHLKEAVRESDAVLISLPTDQIENTLKEIADELKDGAVVINTRATSAAFIQMAQKWLPEERFFISMIPAFSGTCLNESLAESIIPRADVFSNADMLIVVDEKTHENAVNLANEITTLVGAKTCFIDPVEADGFLAKVELLPKLTSAVLLMATMYQPGWQESRRIASSAYAKAASAINDNSAVEQPGMGILANRENVLYALDGLMTSLMKIRTLIDEGDQARLDELLTGLQQDYSEWHDQRTDGKWEKEMHNTDAKPASIIGRLFGSGLKNRK